jgi:WhiB family transcriptional regulator, redox-sensing transcriptional regulator
VNEALVQWLMAPEAEGVPITLEDFLGRPSWMQQGLRRGMTAVFFSTAPSNLERARAICAACPVRQECYDFAMSDPDLLGVFGGTTERERRELRRGAVA